MQNNPVAWFEIYVQDMDRAKAFYEGVLQIRLKDWAPPEGQPAEQAATMWAFPMSDGHYGASGALAQMEGVTPWGGGTKGSEEEVEPTSTQSAPTHCHCLYRESILPTPCI